jgi:hypothetical protein
MIALMTNPPYDGGHHWDSCVGRLTPHNKGIRRRSQAPTWHLPIHAFRPSESGVQNTYARAPHYQTILAGPRHTRRKGTPPRRHFSFSCLDLSIYQLLFRFFFVHLWFYILVHSGAPFHSSSTVSLALPAATRARSQTPFFAVLSVHTFFCFSKPRYQRVSFGCLFRLLFLGTAVIVSRTKQGWFGEATRVEEKGELFSGLLPRYLVFGM